MDRNELISNLRMDIAQLYVHEDDAYGYENQARDLANADGASEDVDYLENLAEQEQEAAHQLKHIIQCDLLELSEIEDRPITMEDFTDGEFKS